MAAIPWIHATVYWDSKLLGPVVCFADLVQTSLWAVWADKMHTTLNFCPRQARKEMNVPRYIK